MFQKKVIAAINAVRSPAIPVRLLGSKLISCLIIGQDWRGAMLDFTRIIDADDDWIKLGLFVLDGCATFRAFRSVGFHDPVPHGT